MLPRPAALGSNPQLETLEDVDAALHEMAWLDAKRILIETETQTAIEKLKKEANAKLVVTVEGEQQTIKARADQLSELVTTWAEESLKAHLKGKKRSLSLAHGEVKLRALPAAVELPDGVKPAAIALAVARAAGVLSKVKELLDGTIPIPGDSFGIAIRDVIGIDVSLAKEAIKDEWLGRPEVREYLQSLGISVIDDQEQITVKPADLQVNTHAE